MGSFGLSFSRPDLLWLLALTPLLYFVARRSLVGLTPERWWTALAIRTLVSLFLVFALAGARWVRKVDELCVLFLLDASASARADVDAEVLQRVSASFATMQSKDKAGVVTFGEEAMVEFPPAHKPALDVPETVPTRRRTDLSRALRLAAGLFPDHAEKRVVLFSDGNENIGSVEREARMAKANRIRVDVVPLERARDDELVVESVDVPEREDVERPFEIKVTVRSESGGPATLRLFRDGAFVGKQEVELRPGKNIFVVPHVEKDAGFHTYEAMVESLRDSIGDNNRAAAFSFIKGQSRALLVGAPEDTRFLAEALRAEKIPVVSRLDAPRSVAEAQNFDAVLLVNVPATGLTNGQMTALHTYVRDTGGGLAMVGGEDAFGVGGYKDTPVEEALPVKMDLKDKRKFPSLAMVMVIDKSGSMATGNGGESKIKLASAAAARAVELMTARDRVGVIAFDSAGKWVQTMTGVADRSPIVRRIFSIQAGGGTAMYPGLEMAVEALEAEETQIKHIIALTDGMTAPGDWDFLVGRMNAGNITLSTVAVGQGADKRLLDELAYMGKGRFYETDDPANVPRIFTKETVLTQRSYLIEQEFVPAVARTHETIKGIASAPSLLGYVATEAKPRAEVVLQSTVPDHDEPVLAVWRHGLGKAVAFTSDARDRWAAGWIGWDGFSKFWPQVTRWMMRGRQEGALRPRVVVEGDRGRVIVDAIDERDETFVNFLELTANVVTPDMRTLALPLRQTGPGRYEAEFDAPDAGAYIVTAYGGEQPPATTGHVISYPAEFRDLRPNHFLLSQIAEATGGRVDPPATEWFRHEGGATAAPHEIWYPLTLLALLLFLLDVAVRRVRLAPEHWEAVRAAVAPWIPGFSHRPAGADDRLRALKQRKRALGQRLTGKDRSDEPEPQEAPEGAARARGQEEGKPGLGDDGNERETADAPVFMSREVAERLNLKTPGDRPKEQTKRQEEDARKKGDGEGGDSTTGRLLAARRRTRKKPE